jgi:hypothetical protein
VLTDPRDIPVPCVTAQYADDLAATLRAEGVDVSRVDGLTVYVPTNRPAFAWDVAEYAVRHGYAADSDAASAVADFLAGWVG